MSPTTPGATPAPAVAVIGGGIAGLAAAWELVAGSPGAVPEVVVFEADDRLGGKLRSETFGDRRVDVAADAFLARRPEGTDLCQELGLTDRLIPVGASGASVWARGRLRPMPAGLNLGVPTRWWPLVRSGILGPAESARVLKDLVVPHLGRGQTFGDQTVGAIVGSRLGRPVVDRLADPLIGGINAGSVDRLSAAATFPVLIAASHQSGSLMRRLGVALAAAARSGPGPSAPVFWSLADSTASLVDNLVEALAARGVTFRTGVPVDAIDRLPDAPGARARWGLTLGSAGPAADPAGGPDSTAWSWPPPAPGPGCCSLPTPRTPPAC